MYLDKVEFNDVDEATELLEISSIYVGFERLKYLCGQYLLTFLDSENAVSLYLSMIIFKEKSSFFSSVGSQFFESTLRSFALFHIISDLKNVEKTEEWKHTMSEVERSALFSKATKWGFY